MTLRIERSHRKFEDDFARALRKVCRDRARNDAKSHLDTVKAEKGEEYSRHYVSALHSLTADKDGRVTAMLVEHNPLRAEVDYEIKRVFGAKGSWECPIHSPGCTRNCGAYGCGG